MILLSIRLHIIFRDDVLRTKSLVDKSLLLKPADLVAYIADVELTHGIDIGAVADYLLAWQVRILRNDHQQSPGLFVDRRLAGANTRQNHDVIFQAGANTADQGAKRQA